MPTKIITFAAVLLLGAAGSRAAEVEAIAVLPLRTTTLDSNITAVLDNLLVSTVDERGAFRVIGANDIAAMLGMEKMRDLLGCSDTSCAAEIGGALGARYLLSGTVDALGSSLLVTLTLLDNQRATAVSRKRVKVENNQDYYFGAIERLVEDTFSDSEVASLLKPRPPSSSRSSAASTKAPPPKPAPPPGRIEVHANKPGQVFLNGRSTGQTTPAVLEQVPPGSHRVEVRTEDAYGVGEVTVEAGQTQQITVAVSRSMLGRVTIRGNVEGAVAVVNGQEVGALPQTLEDLPAGTHRVEVRAPDHVSWSNEIRLEREATVEVQADLVPHRNHSITGATEIGIAGNILLVGGVAEYRLRHRRWLATHFRAGGGLADRLFWPGSTAYGFFAVGEELILAVGAPGASIPTVLPWPVELFLSVDVEARILDTPFGAVVAGGGVRLWWLYARGHIGVAFDSTGAAVAAGGTFGANFAF